MNEFNEKEQNNESEEYKSSSNEKKHDNKEESHKSIFENIPNEVLYNISESLGAKDLANLEAVSNTMFAKISGNKYHLWKDLLMKKFSISIQAADELAKNKKNGYKDAYNELRNYEKEIANIWDSEELDDLLCDDIENLAHVEFLINKKQIIPSFDAILKAAKDGSLEVLRFTLRHGQPLINQGFKKIITQAAYNDDKRMIAWLYEYAITNHQIDIAANALSYCPEIFIPLIKDKQDLLEKDFKNLLDLITELNTVNKALLSHIIVQGSLSLSPKSINVLFKQANSLDNNVMPLIHQKLSDSKFALNVCQEAVSQDNIELVRFLVDNHYILLKEVCELAIGGSSEEVVEFICENYLNKIDLFQLLLISAKYDDINIASTLLEQMEEVGQELSDGNINLIYKQIAEHKSIKLLKWFIKENSLPITEELINTAFLIFNKNQPIYSLIRSIVESTGESESKNLLILVFKQAINHNNEDIVNYFIDNRKLPVDKDIIEYANSLTDCDPSILENLAEKFAGDNNDIAPKL